MKHSEPSYSAGAGYFGTHLAAHQKVRVTVWSIPFLDLYPRELKIHVHTKTCTYSRMIHNSQKVKTIRNVHQLMMDKQNGVYSYNGQP